MDVLKVIVLFVQAMLVPKVDLVAENVTSRHQLAVLTRSLTHPHPRLRDRVFWVLVSRRPAGLPQWRLPKERTGGAL